MVVPFSEGRCLARYGGGGGGRGVKRGDYYGTPWLKYTKSYLAAGFGRLGLNNHVTPVHSADNSSLIVSDTVVPAPGPVRAFVNGLLVSSASDVIKPESSISITESMLP